MGRSDSKKKRIEKRLCRITVMVLLCGLLVACKGNVAPNATPSSALAPTPAPTETPPIGNPVAAFWRSFFSVAEPALLDMEAVVEEQVLFLDGVMEVRRHIQRLQHVFLPFESLIESGESLWDGMLLLGADGGTGAIQGSYEQAAFSGTFYNGMLVRGSLDAGRIAGVLEKYVEAEVTGMDADTEEEDVPMAMGTYEKLCDAEIYWDDDGIYAAVEWEGKYSMFFVKDMQAYFAGERKSAIDIGLGPEAWADWKFESGVGFSRCAWIEIGTEGESDTDEG